jgi:hypothetical protein
MQPGKRSLAACSQEKEVWLRAARKRGLAAFSRKMAGEAVDRDRLDANT